MFSWYIIKMSPARCLTFNPGFFMLSADPSLILGADMRIKRCNRAFTRNFSRDGRKIMGSFFYHYFIDADKKNIEVLLLKARHESTDLSLETAFISPEGDIGWIQWKIVPHPFKRIYYAAGRDITRLKRKEEQLRISYTAMESAANGIYLLDAEEVITWVNSSFLKISGFSREDIVGKTPGTMSSGYHSREFFNALRDTLESGMVWTGEVVNRRPDGSLYTIEQTIAPIFTPHGEPTYFVAVMQDISERKRTQQILEDNFNQLNRDMDMAGKVQASLLPASLPVLEGYDIEALAIPARHVSGDLYDCFVPSEHSCFLAMADISGKGVPSAMLASSLKTLLRAGSSSYENPARFLSMMNQKLYSQLSSAEMFITLCATSFNPETAILRYASAGHTQGIIIKGMDNSIELFPATGIPLGILEEITLTEVEAVLVPGDTFILYSDGITEARNSRWELFGMKRLIEILETPETGGAGAIINKITSAVNSFRGDTPLSDDLSLVVLCAQPRILSFDFEAELKNLEDMTAKVRLACTPYGPEFCYAMELSASELLTNVIRHSHNDSGGIVRMSLSLRPDRVELDIYDSAESFLYEILPEPDDTDLREGGYGLAIVRKLCDELTCVPEYPAGNHWHAMKRRAE